ncbi:MAG: Gfo/Idh/MocA family oxidoreductase [Acidobacteriota bacterium]
MENLRPSSTSPLIVAILGAGNMGVCLARAFSKVSGVAVKYVYSRTLSRAKSVADSVGALAVDRPELLFEDKDVDVVTFCLPTDTRLDFLTRAVRAEKHIFCEKPLALDPQMANDIRKLLNGYSKTVMVGHVLRFAWEFSHIRRIVQDDGLGRIGSIRMSRLVGYPGSDAWFTDSSRSGGIVLDLMIHDIDFLLWTFGEVGQVYARLATETGMRKADYALVNLQLESGAVAHLEGSWAHPVGSFRQTIEVCGSKGLLQHDSASSKPLTFLSTRELTGVPASRISIPESDEASDPYLAEVRHFVECVRSGREPMVRWQEAIEACEVAFLAIESARQGVALRSKS